jgi:site-specific DNA recombinase
MKNGVAAIYCRVSTEEQAKLGQSLSVQLKTLEEYAKERDYRVYDTYIDEGHSGADFSRPHLSRLREDAQDHRFNVVIATHLDRLGRDGPELLSLLYKEFTRSGIHAEFITEGLNSSDDKDELVIYIRAQQAAEFRKRLSQRSHASKIHLVESGKWVGGAPPVGYELDRSTHTLKICREEAKLVKKVIEFHLQGWGITAITYELNRLEFPAMTARVFLPSPRFCVMIQKEKHSKSCYLRPFHEEYRNHCIACIEQFGDQAKHVERNGIGKTTVSRIVQQDLYKGHMVWGRTKNNHQEEGPYRNRQDRQHWVSSENCINDSLVTEEEFTEIGRRRRANHVAPAKARAGTYVLAGLLKCGNCGAPMNGHTSDRYWVGYFCSTRKNKGPSVCDMGTVKAKIVEPYVEEQVRQFAQRIERESMFAEKHVIKESQFVLDLRDDIERLERMIEDNDHSTDRWVTLFEEGNHTPQSVKERLEKLERERNSLDLKIKNRTLQLDDALGERPSLEELLEIARKFDRIWGDLDIEVRKELLRVFVDTITVFNDGRIKIVFAV